MAESIWANGRLAAGGGRPSRAGSFVEPTVVTDLPHGHALERDAQFMREQSRTIVG